MLVCTLGGLHMGIWPLFLVGGTGRPLRSAKKPGVVCKKIPDLDIHLACHIDPDTAIRQDHRFEVPEPPARKSDA